MRTGFRYVLVASVCLVITGCRTTHCPPDECEVETPPPSAQGPDRPSYRPLPDAVPPKPEDGPPPTASAELRPEPAQKPTPEQSEPEPERDTAARRALPRTAKEVADGTRGTWDPYLKMTTIKSPRYWLEDDTFAVLRTWGGRGAWEGDHQLYVCHRDTATSPDLATAWDRNGIQRPVEVLGRDRLALGGSEEHVAIAYSERGLGAAVEDDLALRIYGARSNLDVFLPGYFVAGYLEAVRGLRRRAER